MADETKAKFGDRVTVTVKRGKAITEPVKREDRRYGPPPFGEEKPGTNRPVTLTIADISTRYGYNNRTNNGSVTTLVLGRAAIGVQQSRFGNIFWAGDTYGVSLVSFTTELIAQSNDALLYDLFIGGG